ncbi:hypothetical protein, partial [Mycobacterium sp. 1274756.6]|uniref:hypothetical protein n=1 Tax=Mycobacterium sp. 1274756.6 TaxID=1834076 RepID=UPI0007FEC4DC
PTPDYPAQSRYAFAPGVTCVTTPAGAVLLNPPRSEKLTGLPADPATALPTAEELTGILDNLVDPEVSDEVKSDLVAGGLDRHRANVFNHKLRQAGHHGALPLTFTADNITAAGENTVTSDVTVTGPKMASPIEKNVTFVNQNGWMLSQAAGDELVEAIVGRLPN